MESSEKSPESLAAEVRVFFRKGAHDIQNLFQGINLWLRTGKVKDQEQATRLLHEMQAHYTREISRLQRSFDTLLSIRTDSKLPTPVNVSAVVDTVLQKMNWPPDVRIEKEITPDLLLCFSETHLQNALRALLDNAVRYQPPEQLPVVTVRAYATDNGIRCSVADNGTGIDLSRYQQQVFAPFMRCTDQGEGQGISLHLVKVMAEQYGGKVQLESEVGVGTSVTLYLPNQAPAAG